jgi:hypothetical protein
MLHLKSKKAITWWQVMAFVEALLAGRATSPAHMNTRESRRSGEAAKADTDAGHRMDRAERNAGGRHGNRRPQLR